MAHIHLCWELGAGLGHAGRLKSLALPLIARGHHVTMSLRDLVHTHQMLADLAIPKLQAPVWLHRTEGLPPDQASLAEILLGCGYLVPHGLEGLVAGWRALFQQLRPDLVVCDYAPTAVLAARSLGVRSATVGVGFYMPPAGVPLPPLRDWEPPQAQRMATTEARLLDTCNTILARYGAAPLRHGVDLLLGDAPQLCTWPELDHYGRADTDSALRWFGPNIPPHRGEAPQWPDGDGPKVFVYLRDAHPELAALLQALADEGCRVLCYVPEVAAGKAAPVASPRIRYARGPVDLDAAFAGCALAVSHGGESVVAQALLAGVPMLLMPYHAEMFLMARRVRQMGAGINAGELARPVNWRAQVRRLLDEPGFSAAAGAFAQRYRGFSPACQAGELAGVFEQLAGLL